MFLMPPCCPRENSTNPVPEPRNDWLQYPTEAILVACIRTRRSGLFQDVVASAPVKVSITTKTSSPAFPEGPHPRPGCGGRPAGRPDWVPGLVRSVLWLPDLADEPLDLGGEPVAQRHLSLLTSHVDDLFGEGLHRFRGLVFLEWGRAFITAHVQPSHKTRF